MSADAWTCPGCHGLNPGATRFCGHCGQPVPGGGSETGPTSKPAGDERKSEVRPEERRLVTAVFADISGFTTLAEQLDAEPLHEIIAPIVSRLAAVAERYGGFVAKFAGDALLVVFGAPVAQEDHAVRGLLMSLDMRQELATSVRQLPPQARGLQLHVGVNSGWVVAGMFGGETADYSVLGDAVNLAQRLQSVAPPGEIYVGERTAQLARGQFELVALGELHLKGMTRPVRAWQLVGAVKVGHGLPTWAGADRFVGREPEMARAGRVLELLTGGHGAAFAVVGEPGIGKSRFIQELRRAYRQVRWLDSHCLSYMTSVAYGPFVDLVRREFGISPSESSLGGAARIAESLAANGLSRAYPYFAHLAGVSDAGIDEHGGELSPAAFRAGLHRAFADWATALARTKPVVLILEDVHWADASTLELIAELARLTEELPITVCLTGRPEAEAVIGSIMQSRRRGSDAWIRLEALGKGDLRALLERMLGEDAPDDLVRIIAERTDGNPFFAEEMVRSLLDAGALERREAWQLRPDWDAASVPPNIEGLLAARMDRLPRPAATLLGVAAVIGRRIQVPLLAALAPAGTETDLALRHLVEQAFLEWLPSDPEEAVAFRHVLTLEVAYLRQIRRRRQELHRRVAEVGESLYGSGDDVIDFLAGHLYRAEALPQAINYLLRAGERAKRLFANHEALDHFIRGLELVPLLEDPSEQRLRELELQSALANPLIAVKGHGSDEVGALCARVKELCQQIGNRPELFPTLLALVGFHLMRGEFGHAADAGTSLMSVAETSGQRALLLVGDFAHGLTLYCRGDLGAARRHLEHGVELYHPAEDASLRFEYVFDPGIGCHRALSLVLWLAGEPDAAVEQSETALRLAREQPHPYGLVAVLLYAAILRHYRREPAVALRYAEEAVALSAEHGFPLWSMWGKILRDSALIENPANASPEELTRRVAQLRDDVNGYEQAGLTLFLPYWLGLLSAAYARAGRVGEGVACLSRALFVAERSGEKVWEPELHRIRGELFVDLYGDVGEAERSFRWGMAVADQQGARSLGLRTAVSLARLLGGEGRHDEARQVLEESIAWFTEGLDTADLREAHRLLFEFSGNPGERPMEMLP